VEFGGRWEREVVAPALESRRGVSVGRWDDVGGKWSLVDGAGAGGKENS